MKKVGRNESCPCGSGKKYKKCCYSKDFTWNRDDNETIVRSVPLSDEAVQFLKDLKSKQEKELGRPVEDSDPIFRTSMTPDKCVDEVCKIMEKCDFDKAYIYAVKKTRGLMPTQENIKLIPEKDLQEFNDAYNEYADCH